MVGQPFVICNPGIRGAFGAKAQYRLTVALTSRDPNVKASLVRAGVHSVRDHSAVWHVSHCDTLTIRRQNGIGSHQVRADARRSPRRAAASPALWFIRIACDRCDDERMFSGTHATQSDMSIHDILTRMRHDCGGSDRASSRQQQPGASDRAGRRVTAATKAFGAAAGSLDTSPLPPAVPPIPSEGPARHSRAPCDNGA